MEKFDQELLTILLRYDENNGKLFWNKRTGPSGEIKRWNGRYAGKEAFARVRSDGYLDGKIMGKRFLAHRIIWLIVNGTWPSADIDHIDHDRTNNKITNLRDVSRMINNRNRPLVKTNKTGVAGVSQYKNTDRWLVKVSNIYIGLFDCFEEAISARNNAKIGFGFHINSG